MRLKGKVALVTGAADGPKAALGALFAKALAQEGASVAVVDKKDGASVAEAIAARGGSARAFRADVSDPRSVGDLFADVDRAFGRIDILVNNAAIGSNIPPIPIEDMTLEAWEDCMAVNVRGTFLCTQAAVPSMRRNGYGKIINLSSTTILSGLPNRLHYVASKGAIAAMTRSMAQELGPSGIRVNSLAPALVMNDSVAAVFAARPGHEEHILGGRAIKQHVHGQDLIGTLIYLVAPDSDAVTGQFLIIDNGGDFT